MSGKGIQIIASSRGVFALAPDKLTFAIPSEAQAGDILLALIVHPSNEILDVAPAGWTSGGAFSATVRLTHYMRVHDGTELEPLVASIVGAPAVEWQGVLVVLQRGTLATLIEGTANVDFAADATPNLPAIANQQALNLALCVWSAANAIDFTAPAGFTTIDEYSTNVVTQRSLLVAWRQTKLSTWDDLALPAAAANPAATGRSFVYLLRERPILMPATLDDPVPGNIGLLP